MVWDEWLHVTNSVKPLLLFFGIHMANAATLAARELAKEETLKKRKTA